MSASTRGFLLQATGDRLVIQASPDEVAQFGAQAQVQVTQHLERWAARQAAAQTLETLLDDEGPWMDEDRMHFLGSAPALLRTLCGCLRVVMVPLPPPLDYRVAIHETDSMLWRADSTGHLDPTMVMSKVRTFGYPQWKHRMPDLPDGRRMRQGRLEYTEILT